jgi:beta-glucosidase
MKKTSFLAIGVALSLFSACENEKASQGGEVAKGADEALESRVDSLMALMTPAEKAGQMTQVNLNVVLVSADGSGYNNDEGIISDSALDLAVNKYKVGSILNAINHAYSQEHWHQIITKIQDKTKEGDGVNIPVLYGIDAIHGTTFTLNSTLFPHNIGMAASRNPENSRIGASITAEEVRASGIRWNFNPVFDLGRNPLWPRFGETFGEDPYLCGVMGTAVVRGHEEDGLNSLTGVAACMKHFVGYSASRSGRDRTPSYIPELELREYYLPQFQRAIKAGASTIMINSGELNGVPVHGSKYLLTTVLREELGFKGLVVTDWEDVNRLNQRHMVAPTMKEAVRQGVLAGIDMSMTPHDFIFAEELTKLYDEDEEVKARVNESVKRILMLKGKLGLLDFATSYPEKAAFANFGKKEFADAALTAALESMTLLKNGKSWTQVVGKKKDGSDSIAVMSAAAALPLAKTSRVLIVGPNANNIPSLHGCWSYSWQGADYTYKIKKNSANPHGDSVMTLFPASTISIKTAFEEMLGKGNVICRSSADYNAPENYQLGNASGVDAIILCLGENSYAESPGSIQDLNLDPRQMALAKQAIATGKKVILVLVEGRPRVITDIVEGKNSVDAVLQAYWPGSQGARAIAKTVLGEYNPGGKLPYSYPRSTGDIVPYDYKWTEMNVEASPGGFTDTGYNPLFAFGHGLSYTTFTYTNFKIADTTLTGSDTLKVTVTIKNTGTAAGDEVVELYTRDRYASVVPNNRRLRQFQRINLAPGQEKVVEFKLTAEDLKMAVEKIDGKNKTYSYETEEGEFYVMIGGLGWELTQPEYPWLSFLDRTHKQAIKFVYKK